LPVPACLEPTSSVTDDWPLRDGWRAVCVRTPAEDGELAELADVAAHR
jgi:hypothetical protein